MYFQVKVENYPKCNPYFDTIEVQAISIDEAVNNPLLNQLMNLLEDEYNTHLELAEVIEVNG